MAVTLQLTDGTNAVNLNDGSIFTTRDLAAPAPKMRQAFAGQGNLFRSGAYLVDQAFDNRFITVVLMIDGSSMDDMIDQVQNVHDILRRAWEFSQHGLGSQVYLTYTADGATNATRFHVISGSFDPVGAGVNFPALNIGDTLVDRRLFLICKPFGVMAQEGFTNYVRDPSFEVKGADPSTDWTQAHVATGTSAQDTGEWIFGTTSLKLVMTDSTSGGEWIGRYQDRTSAAAVTWSVYVWGRLHAASNSVLKLVVQFIDSSSNVLLEEEWIVDTTNSTTHSRLVVTAVKSPANTANIRIWGRLESTDVDATGTAYIDAFLALQASSFPIAWMSGREVFNHLENETSPDSQTEINYFDIYDVPGDVPSILQVKASENEAHTDLWLGARHADRLADTGIWHEGEAFTGLTSASDSNSSNGAYGEAALRVSFDATSKGTGAAVSSLTVAHTCTTLVDRALYVFVGCEDASETVPDTVTYNSVSMTQIGTAKTLNTLTISLWRLVAPATGANNIVATYSTACDDIHIGALSYYGVHQSTPEGTVVTASGASTLPTADAGAAVDDMVISGVESEPTSGPFTPGAGQTEHWDQGSASMEGTGSDERAGSTTVTMGYTSSGAVDWVTSTVAVKPLGIAEQRSASAPYVITKSVSTPPRGLYKVLIRVNEQGTGPDMRVGVSLDSAADPTVASEYVAVEGSSFHFLDIGTVTIPLVDTPENMTAPSVTIRISIYDADTTNKDGYIRIDSLILLSVDFGAAIVNKTSGTDVVLVDGISKRRMIVLVDTSDVVQSAPASQSGMPPQAHPLGSRYHMVSDDGAADKADGWTVDVRMEHRFLSLRGTT